VEELLSHLKVQSLARKTALAEKLIAALSSESTDRFDTLTKTTGYPLMAMALRPEHQKKIEERL
jgi:hypothetical protein